jgi:hypothetical protein
LLCQSSASEAARNLPDLALITEPAKIKVMIRLEGTFNVWQKFFPMADF